MNKTYFHMKGFAQGLALKLRRNATRKSPRKMIGDAMRCDIDLRSEFWKRNRLSDPSNSSEFAMIIPSQGHCKLFLTFLQLNHPRNEEFL